MHSRGGATSGEVNLYHVYFLASRRHGTIYIGVTNDLGKRLAEHRDGKGSKFVRRHGVLCLVHVESFGRPDEAIVPEKQLKKWNRGLENLTDRNRQS